MHPESKCALLSLVVIVSTFSSGILWLDPVAREQASPLALYGAPAIGLTSLAVLLRIVYRKELPQVPDFLQEVKRRYFERDGLCFAVDLTVDESSVCWMIIHYQNRYDRPCSATVAVKPLTGFWLTRRSLPEVEATIDVGPAAFGVIRTPWAIPARYQGKRQRLGVGASPVYPHGRGRLVRFRDGMRTHRHDFHDSVGMKIILLVFLLRSSTPAGLRVTLPTNVAEEIPENLTAEAFQLWELGDDVIRDDTSGSRSFRSSRRVKLVSPKGC